MDWKTARWRAAALGVLVVVGCCYPVREKIDLTVCDLAAHPLDLQPLPPPDQTPPPGTSPEVRPAGCYPPPGGATKPGTTPSPAGRPGLEGERPKAKPIEEPAEKAAEPEKSKLERRLTIPPELMPGGVVPTLELGKTPAERERNLKRLLQPLPALSEEPQPTLGPEGRPLTLADLQRLARANSPQVRQAAANVEAMRGAAIQAGLPPNPTVGYEGDTMGTANGAGYQGGFVDQVIKTMNKLQLARSVATMDWLNAHLALRKAQTDLATKVRGGYFAVLVARESVRINRGLVKFTTEVYQVQVEQMRKGLVSPWEPMYLRALAVQARASLVQARNRYTSAWKQLAAAMGLPGLPPTQLAGRIDMPIPVYNHKEVLAYVLSHHTDLQTAYNTWHQSKLNLKLAQATPIPDVEIRAMLQKDNTSKPASNMAPSLAVSFPLPLYNRNQGAIMQAQAQVVLNSEEPHRVRTDLTTRLADAFERYENNRVLLSYYRDQILPDFVRVYRGVTQSYYVGAPLAVEPPRVAGATPFTANLGDIVVAQGNLATALGTYLTTLGAMWQAVVDVTDFLQTNDLFQINQKPLPTQPVAEIPELDHLPPRACEHPCSPVPHLHQRFLDATWPQAAPDAPFSPPAVRSTPTPPTPKPKPAPADKAPMDKPADDKLLPPPRRAPGKTSAPADDPLLAPPPPMPARLLDLPPPAK